MTKQEEIKPIDELTELEIDHCLTALRSFYDKDGGEGWCICCERAEKKLESMREKVVTNGN